MSEWYAEKLKNPRWQAKRLEVFWRDDWRCQNCGFPGPQGKGLEAHHNYYRRGAEPWDYDLGALITLCRICHEMETRHRKQLEEDLLGLFRKQPWWRTEFEEPLLEDIREAGLLGTDVGRLGLAFGRIMQNSMASTAERLNMKREVEYSRYRDDLRTQESAHRAALDMERARDYQQTMELEYRERRGGKPILGPSERPRELTVEQKERITESERQKQALLAQMKPEGAA